MSRVDRWTLADTTQEPVGELPRPLTQGGAALFTALCYGPPQPLLSLSPHTAQVMGLKLQLLPCFRQLAACSKISESYLCRITSMASNPGAVRKD